MAAPTLHTWGLSSVPPQHPRSTRRAVATGERRVDTAADHLQILADALAQFPDESRHGDPILIRADGAGSSQTPLAGVAELPDCLVAAEFSVGLRSPNGNAARCVACLTAPGLPRSMPPMNHAKGGRRGTHRIAPDPDNPGQLPGRDADHRAPEHTPTAAAQLDLLEAANDYRYTAFGTTNRVGQRDWLDAATARTLASRTGSAAGKTPAFGRFPPANSTSTSG